MRFLEMCNNFKQLKNAIEKGGEVSPFLFLSQNLELSNAEILWELQNILREHHIDQQSLFHLWDTWESLKIENIKRFLENGNVRPRFAFQIFFIENFSRATIQAQNACLKFFEEPGEGNIIILSSQGQSDILETILSRVQVLHFGSTPNSLLSHSNDFYYTMIVSHVEKKSDELVRYFFPWKFEKEEYISFLKSLIFYISQTWKYISMLDEIESDINGIMKNNLSGRYIVDKYIVRM